MLVMYHKNFPESVGTSLREEGQQDNLHHTVSGHRRQSEDWVVPCVSTSSGNKSDILKSGRAFDIPIHSRALLAAILHWLIASGVSALES